MDVSTISKMTAQVNTNVNSAVAKSAYGAYSNNAAQKTNSESNSVGNAYEIEISDAAKLAAAQKSTETVAEDSKVEKSKGLTEEQIGALKDAAAMQEQAMLNLMIQTLSSNNDKLQGWLDEGIGILNFGGIQIDASRFALPEVATNPEDAAKAVAEGGEWSVGAVSDRIFDLAETLAGGDPEKLEEMRAAVEEGFKQAGMAWKDATGSNEMPDITQQTYQELMHRFDTVMSKLTSGNLE